MRTTERVSRVLGLVGLLAITILVAAARPLWACDPAPLPPPKRSEPPPESPPCNECACSRSPAYVGSGDYIIRLVDLQLTTPGLPLVASRTYESAHPVPGPIGFGWTSSLSVRLYYATYLFSAPSTYSKAAWITMPDGRRYRYTENSGGVTYTPPLGRHDVLVKNGDLTFDLTLQRSRTKYHFAPTGDLLSMTDDYGNTLNMTYDGNGRPKRLTDAAGSGRYLDITYGADGRISAIADNSGRSVQYIYDGSGALYRVIDAGGRTTTYTYMTAPIGVLLTTATDNWGRGASTVGFNDMCMTESTGYGGETYSYTYHYNSIPTQTAKTDANNNTWVFAFNPAGQITGETFPDGGLFQTDYYADGSVQQTIDQVGVRTFYTYNPQGSVLTVTRDDQGANAVRFEYTYDTNFPEKVTFITPKNPGTGQVDPTWRAWRYDYYQAGSPAPGALFHVYRVRDNGVTLDTLTTYVYNSKGQVTKHTSATGGVTDYTYDSPAGNLWKVQGPANNDGGSRPLTTYGYDAVGRVLSVTDPLSYQTTYAYDGLDRVTSVTLPKPTPSSPLNFTTTYSYDQFDSGTGLTFTHVTDPNGKLTKQGYDAYGRLVQSIDASGNITEYEYTGALLTSITDANDNVTSYGYDSTRRLQTTTFPDGAQETYGYTLDNLLDTKQDRKSQTINHDYDAFKRLKTKTYPGGGSISYTYQGQKLTQVVDTRVSPTETHTFGFDASYRVSTNTQASRGTINYLYNADDTVQNHSIQSGPSSTYTYYPDGSLNTIVWTSVAGTFKYRYTLPGQYQSLTLPSGATRNFTYDDQGRLTNLANLASGGGNLATYAYGYDFNYTTGQSTMLGQRTSLTATVPSQSLNNHLFKYEYDGRYELSKVTYPNVAPFNADVDSWTYDRIGNRLTSTVNGVTANYTYQKIGANPLNWQRLTSDGASAYTYDSNGNTQTRTGSTFTWNYDDRMTGVTGTSSYVYDYQGRRSKKTVGITPSTYLYDGLNLIRETTAGTTSDYLFGPGIDEPIAMSRLGSTYYQLVDGLGSVNLVTNAAGTVQDKYLYDAWGTTRSSTTPVPNPFGYTAREFGEAGTLFYRARYYQASIGRFLAEDPAGVHDGINLYRYVRNSPLGFTDPSGQIVQQCFRPLSGRGFPLTFIAAASLMWFALQPPIPGVGLCAMHSYLYNTDLPPGQNSWGFDPREVRPETGDDTCWDIPEPLGSCMWRQAPLLNNDNGKYNLVTNNCQTALNRAREACQTCPTGGGGAGPW